MTDSLEQLEPKLVWQLFRGMSAVPRPSKHEEKIRAHLRGVAEQAGRGGQRGQGCGQGNPTS